MFYHHNYCYVLHQHIARHIKHIDRLAFQYENILSSMLLTDSLNLSPIKTLRKLYFIRLEVNKLETKRRIRTPRIPRDEITFCAMKNGVN